MFRRILIFSIVVIIFCFSFARAIVTFIPDTEIYLPDSFYIDNKTSFEFEDINNDYVDEVIIENDSIIASFSLKDNQTIDYFVKPVDTFLNKYTWDYIDDDSLLDFVRVTTVNPDTFMNVFATFFLSTEDFLPSDSAQIYYASGFDYCYEERIGYPNKLFLKDNNSDGVKELYVRLSMYRHINYISYGRCIPLFTWEYIKFESYKYALNGDTAILIDQLPNNSDQQYNLYDDMQLYEIEVDDGMVYYRYDVQIPNPTAYKWSSVHIYESDYLVFSDSLPYLYGCGVPQRWIGERTARFLKYRISDCLTSSPGYEIIGLVYQNSNSDPFYDVVYPYCDSSSWHLVCYDLSTPDTLVELWNNILPDSTSIDLIFSDSLFPDKFFTFSDNRFYLHNSENGEMLDSSNMTDQRILDYRAVNACDPKEEAIFIDGNNLIFYRVRVPTSVDEGSDNLMPVAFLLGQPYPNPYNARLSIPIDVARKTNLKVEIYDILGRHVAHVYDKQAPPGELILDWDSENYPSGIYFIRARTDNQTQTAKAVLLK